MSRLLIALLLFPFFLSPLFAEEWPSWRGPRGDGTSAEKGIPTQWTTSDNVVWKAAVPGRGYSSPVVHGNRIFLTTCIEENDDRLLLCLDRRTGKELWRRTVLQAPLEKKHGLNSYASSTPATDGERVYVTFLSRPNMEVVCYDVDGKKLWQRSPGKLLSVHGFCTSPVLHKDLVILNGDQDATAYIVALDKKTGEEKWRADRPNKTRSYCTPILIPDPKRHGVTQLVLSGSQVRHRLRRGHWQAAVDSRRADGAVRGQPRAAPGHPVPDHRASPSITSWASGPTARATSQTASTWSGTSGTRTTARGAPPTCPRRWPTTGYFFVVSDPGFLGCIEAKTGKRLWMKKLGRRHSASPVLIEGRMVIPDDDGKVWVVNASPEFKVVECNDMGETHLRLPGRVARANAAPHGQASVLHRRGEEVGVAVNARVRGQRQGEAPSEPRTHSAAE